MKKAYDQSTKLSPKKQFDVFLGDIKEFMWCATIVCSRNFLLRFESEGKLEPTMVPIADMVNHYHDTKQTTWNYNIKTNFFEIEALRQISSGSQVFDSYGEKSLSKYDFFV